MSVAKTDITDLIEDIVGSISFTVTIESRVHNGSYNYTLTVCDLGYSQVGRTVTINGNDYTIESIDYDLLTMTVQGSAAIASTVTTFTLYSVQFYKGTPFAVNTELSDKPNASDKTPMVFLAYPVDETFEEDDESVTERTSELQLFFLTTPAKGFDLATTADLQKDGIKPMQRLRELFIEEMKEDPLFVFDEVKSSVRMYTKFGAYITNKGIASSIFVDELSGVGQDLNIERLKDLTCHDC